MRGDTMKPKERDELLIRLDERSRNIWTLTEKQESHLSKLNDNMMKHAVQISSNKTSLRWIIRIASGLIILGGTATGLVTWLG